MASSSPPVTKVCYVRVRPMSVVAECQAIAYIQSSFKLADEKSGKQLLDLPYTSIFAMDGDITNGELTIVYIVQSKTGPVQHRLQLQCEASDVRQQRCAIDFISTYMDYINPSPTIDHYPPTEEVPRHSYAIEWPDMGISPSGNSDGGGGAGGSREPSQPVVISPKDGGKELFPYTVMDSPVSTARVDKRQQLKRPDFKLLPLPMPTPARRPPVPAPRSSSAAAAAAVGKPGMTSPPRSPADRFPAGGGMKSPTLSPGIRKLPPLPTLPKSWEQGRIPQSLPLFSQHTASAAHKRPGIVLRPANPPPLPPPAVQYQDAVQSNSCNSEQPATPLTYTAATPATVETPSYEPLKAGDDLAGSATAYEPVVAGDRTTKSNSVRSTGVPHQSLNQSVDAGKVRSAGNNESLALYEVSYESDPIVNPRAVTDLRQGSVNQPRALTTIPRKLGCSTGHVKQPSATLPLPKKGEDRYESCATSNVRSISNDKQQSQPVEPLTPLSAAVLLHSSDPLPLPPPPSSPPGLRQTEQEEDYMFMDSAFPAPSDLRENASMSSGGEGLQQDLKSLDRFLTFDTLGRTGKVDAHQTTNTDTIPNPLLRNRQPNSKHEPAVASGKPPASQKDNGVASASSEETDQPVYGNLPLAAPLREGGGRGALSSGSDPFLSPDLMEPLGNAYEPVAHDSGAVSSDDSDCVIYETPVTPIEDDELSVEAKATDQDSANGGRLEPDLPPVPQQSPPVQDPCLGRAPARMPPPPPPTEPPPPDAAQSSSCNSEQPAIPLKNTAATPATVENSSYEPPKAGGETAERDPAYEPLEACHRKPKSNGVRATGNTPTDAGKARFPGNDKPLGRREAPYGCSHIVKPEAVPHLRRGSANRPYAETNIPQQLGGNTGNVRQPRPMEPLPIGNGTQQRHSGELLPPLYPAVLLHSSDPLPLPPPPLSTPGLRQTEREQGEEDTSDDYTDMVPILPQLPPTAAGQSGQSDSENYKSPPTQNQVNAKKQNQPRRP